ncbi:MAG: hypothetical protein AB7F59_00170 [Bdellovibrionales bacterium]
MINLDPATIEVQTKPTTLEDLKKIAPVLQELIFDAARAVHLQPYYEAAGHIHLSVKGVFHGDAVLFRNFLVDFVNHSELATGVLEYDHMNAPPLSALTQKQQEAFRQIIKDFDRTQKMSIHELASRIQKEVFTESPSGWTPAAKYQAFSLARILNPNLTEEEWTLEIRSIRGSLSMFDTILTLELFHRRIAYLQKKGGLVTLRKRLLSAELSERSAEYYFRQYVSEMRASWDKFKVLMMKYGAQAPSAEDILSPRRSPFEPYPIVRNKKNQSSCSRTLIP